MLSPHYLSWVTETRGIERCYVFLKTHCHHGLQSTVWCSNQKITIVISSMVRLRLLTELSLGHAQFPCFIKTIQLCFIANHKNHHLKSCLCASVCEVCENSSNRHSISYPPCVHTNTSAFCEITCEAVSLGGAAACILLGWMFSPGPPSIFPIQM